MTAVPRRLLPRTLRGRLSLVALATAALLMVVLTAVFNAIARIHLEQQADTELRTRADAVVATVDTRRVPVRVVEMPDDALFDTNVWIYAGTRLVEHPASAPADGRLTRTAARVAAQPGRHCVTLAGNDPIRLCSVPTADPATRTGPPTAVVVAALHLSPYQASADTLLTASLALDGAVLVCTYALTRLAVGRALRPVREMTDQAAQWSAIASRTRFGNLDSPTELARLGVSLDALLDRIRAVLRHERQLTGELSHELRNPLARITAELDWLTARPRSAPDTRTAHTAIADAARSMRTICDTLLNDARGSAHTAPGTTAVPPVLRRLVDERAATSATLLTVSGQDTVVAGVPEALLERMVGPLVDNALRHASTQVVLHTLRDGAGVRVDVLDDGPGVPGSFVASLFQPGRRADPDDGHEGAGLGLPLARRLARSAGGDVRYEPRHPSGARFTITLPAG
ncbi:sensor histidine kinase [Streptomyces sp. NPDC002574]|uniref:sensor histidine kinase n=1 Tax=Streptomyces sp. NPDC002574 TaxID=3364652 RepID=UPI0036A805F7